jgi:hypothetical protein
MSRVSQQDSAGVIGTAMRERLRAALQYAGRDSGLPRNNAKDSAHSELSLDYETGFEDDFY